MNKLIIIALLALSTLSVALNSWDNSLGWNYGHNWNGVVSTGNWNGWNGWHNGWNGWNNGWNGWNNGWNGWNNGWNGWNNGWSNSVLVGDSKDQ